jgi:hypothetical protein
MPAYAHDRKALGHRHPDVTVSKSAHDLFRRCRLRWYWEKVERRTHDLKVPDGAPLRVGRAGHEAVAALLRERMKGHDVDRQAVATQVVERFGLKPGECELAVRGAIEADQLAVGRGGRIALVEWSGVLRHLPSTTVLRGRVDAVIEGGSRGGIEIIDWTFGRPRLTSPAQLASSVGTGIYCQLVGRHLGGRPITVTEAPLTPFASSLSTTFSSRDELMPTLRHLTAEAKEMQLASRSGEVAPTRGLHCRWCPYRPSCPLM